MVDYMSSISIVTSTLPRHSVTVPEIVLYPGYDFAKYVMVLHMFSMINNILFI